MMLPMMLIASGPTILYAILVRMGFGSMLILLWVIPLGIILDFIFIPCTLLVGGIAGPIGGYLYKLQMAASEDQIMPYDDVL